MNKYEKNIVDILTFDEIEDIVNIFIDKVYYTDKTVAFITNKELVEYAMDELLDDSFISVKRVDLELEDEDTEYMISVDDDGYMVVQPVEYYDDKYFNGIEYAFVDMDGCVSQVTIDALLDRNVPVVLFGYDEYEDEYDCDDERDCCNCEECDCCDAEYDDEYEGYTVNGSHVSKAEFDRYVSQFKADEQLVYKSTKSSYTINGKSVTKEEFDKKYEEFEEMYMDNIRDMMLNYCEFMDEVNEWKRLFRW